MSIEIVMVKTKNLKPAEYNPRLMSKHDADQLAHSMTEFGVVDPIIVNSHPSRNNIIIGGHQRYYIAKQLNYEELPVVYVPIDDIKREKELNVRLNKNVGEWDWEKLANEFDVDFLKDVGFTDKEMSVLSAEDIEEDEVPEAPKKARAKKGEIYLLGRHRLMCGDSTKIEDVERLMDGKKADMVFTDMPYGIDKDGIENDNLKGSDFDDFNDGYISILPVNDDCGFVCYHSTRTFNPTINSAVRNGWKFEKMLFFNRPDKFPVHTWNGWMMTSQAILLFSKGKPKYNKVHPAEQDVYRITSKDLIEGKVSHPTVKPLGNIRDLMKHYEAKIVYEPFLGSGSTLIACEQTNRICYGMEIDPIYCDVIIERYCNLVGADKEEIYEKAKR